MIIENKILTKEDVVMLNLEPNSFVILKNTIGQNPDVIEMISPKVKLQVLGAYNSQITKRFAETKYQERTFYSPQVLASAIRKMEDIEKEINENWTQMEKALFVFDKLVKTVDYDYAQKYADHNRNLESLTNNFARCAGFSVCYKEMMDRLHIENEFKNVPGIHSFNVLRIDGKQFIVDVTWASNNYCNNEEYLHNFGCLKNADTFLTHTIPGEHIKYGNLKQQDVEKTFHNLEKKTKELKIEPAKQPEKQLKELKQ